MKKILIIEDDYSILDLIAKLLEKLGYEVFLAQDGVKGIELAKLVLPDLIICDIAMPKLDGYDVLKSLSQDPKTNPIPFIYLTAKSEKEDIRKGMLLGADSYITKPFTASEIITVIEKKISKYKKETKTIVKDAYEKVSDSFKNLHEEVPQNKNGHLKESDPIMIEVDHNPKLVKVKDIAEIVLENSK